MNPMIVLIIHRTVTLSDKNSCLLLCIKQEVKVHGLQTNKLLMTFLQTLGYGFLKAEIFEKQIL